MEGKVIGKIVIIISVIMGILIAFSMMSGTTNEVKASAQAISKPNNCTYVFNFTDNKCYNSSSMGGGEISSATLYSLPLSGLFTPTGVMVLILMVALFIGILLFSIKLLKK